MTRSAGTEREGHSLADGCVRSSHQRVRGSRSKHRHARHSRLIAYARVLSAWFASFVFAAPDRDPEEGEGKVPSLSLHFAIALRRHCVPEDAVTAVPVLRQQKVSESEKGGSQGPNSRAGSQYWFSVVIGLGAIEPCTIVLLLLVLLLLLPAAIVVPEEHDDNCCVFQSKRTSFIHTAIR